MRFLINLISAIIKIPASDENHLLIYLIIVLNNSITYKYRLFIFLLTLYINIIAFVYSELIDISIAENCFPYIRSYASAHQTNPFKSAVDTRDL